jgi:queuine tRNA-ribosyltransferase
VKSGEIIASMLLTWHNLTYYQDLMTQLRAAIALGSVRETAMNIAAAYSRDAKRND